MDNHRGQQRRGGNHHCLGTLLGFALGSVSGTGFCVGVGAALGVGLALGVGVAVGAAVGVALATLGSLVGTSSAFTGLGRIAALPGIGSAILR